MRRNDALILASIRTFLARFQVGAGSAGHPLWPIAFTVLSCTPGTSLFSSVSVVAGVVLVFPRSTFRRLSSPFSPVSIVCDKTSEHSGFFALKLETKTKLTGV